ncbi:MAG: Arc family DNA binding domain-containing protein [Ignavibacteriae bacterium]|nr:Arc family DNA binding domain-containing protein [Ignavibacteriota bacterium]
MAQKKAVILRIDPNLWKDINVWAMDELRSLNGQVEYVLREAVRKRKGEKKKT